MKSQELKAKFPNHDEIFVRPLYKKIKYKSRGNKRTSEFANESNITSKALRCLATNVKVGGIVKNCERNILITDNVRTNETFEDVLPGVCVSLRAFKTFNNNVNITTSNVSRCGLKSDLNRSAQELKSNINRTMLQENGSRADKLDKGVVEKDTQVKLNISDNYSKDRDGFSNVSIGMEDTSVDKVFQYSRAGIDDALFKDCWLRMLPASRQDDEPWYVVLMRCLACQLGLTAFLVLWTAVGAILVYCAEGPYEEAVSSKFRKRHHQLAIELATELRQITAVSPAWLEAIQRRLSEELDLTLAASAQGAKQNGRYWDPIGALLFMVHAMISLGFGAPAPRTVLGGTTAVIYSIVAVPTHMFLVLNASTALMATVRARRKELQNHTRLIFVDYLCYGQGVSLAIATYYALGYLAFGLLRGKAIFNAFLFPFDFAASDGLEHLSGALRACYAAYFEGAVLLVACAWAAARRHWRNTLLKYHIYSVDGIESRQHHY